MNEENQAKLKANLETLLADVDEPAGVKATIRRAMKEHWTELCWFAERYWEGGWDDTWGNAATQWNGVVKAAHALTESLGKLGSFAQLFTNGPNSNRKIAQEIKMLALQAETLALEAERASQSLQADFNGTHREDDFWPQIALVGGLVGLLNHPEEKCPRKHARRIAAAIHHCWRPESKALDNKRFSERASIKMGKLDKQCRRIKDENKRNLK